MTDQAVRVVLDDPHKTGPAEAETLRTRTLSGVWRWLLVALTAVTIFLCINQQFTLRFFVGFTPLNTEYFYLLILCMLPFTFVIFPGSARPRSTGRLVRCRAVRGHGRRLVLPDDEHPQGRRTRMGIRRSARTRDLGGLPDVDRAHGGAATDRRLEPAPEHPSVHGLSAVRRRLVARAAQGNQSTLDQTTAYHMLSTESLLGIPIQAFADVVIGFLVFGTALMMTGAGKFFINLSFALCGTFRGGAAKVCIFASGLLGMMSGSIVSNVLTAGTMTIPTMKRTGFSPSYSGAIEACASTGAVLAPP